MLSPSRGASHPFEGAEPRFFLQRCPEAGFCVVDGKQNARPQKRLGGEYNVRLLFAKFIAANRFSVNSFRSLDSVVKSKIPIYMTEAPPNPWLSACTVIIGITSTFLVFKSIIQNEWYVLLGVALIPCALLALRYRKDIQDNPAIPFAVLFTACTWLCLAALPEILGLYDFNSTNQLSFKACGYALIMLIFSPLRGRMYETLELSIHQFIRNQSKDT